MENADFTHHPPQGDAQRVDQALNQMKKTIKEQIRDTFRCEGRVDEETVKRNIIEIVNKTLKEVYGIKNPTSDQKVNLIRLITPEILSSVKRQEYNTPGLAEVLRNQISNIAASVLNQLTNTNSWQSEDFHRAKLGPQPLGPQPLTVQTHQSGSEYLAKTAKETQASLQEANKQERLEKEPLEDARAHREDDRASSQRRGPARTNEEARRDAYKPTREEQAALQEQIMAWETEKQAREAETQAILRNQELRGKVDDRLEKLEKSEQQKNIKTLTNIFSEAVEECLKQQDPTTLDILRYNISLTAERINQHIGNSEKDHIFAITAAIIRDKFINEIIKDPTKSGEDVIKRINQAREIFKMVTS